MPCGGPPLTPSAGSPPRSHRSGAGRRRGSGDRLLERLANSISSIASSHGSKSPSLTQRCFNSYPSQRRNDSKSRNFSCARNFSLGRAHRKKRERREVESGKGMVWIGAPWTRRERGSVAAYPLGYSFPQMELFRGSSTPPSCPTTRSSLFLSLSSATVHERDDDASARYLVATSV